MKPQRQRLKTQGLRFLQGSESSLRFTEPPLWSERPIVTRANIFGSPWFGRAFFSYFALRPALLLHFFVFFSHKK